MNNNKVEVIEKALKNLGFTQQSKLNTFESCDVGGGFARVVIGEEGGAVSVYHFNNRKTMILNWKVEYLDLDSVPFAVIYAVINEAKNA
jgi:hypothetical protein